MNYDALQIDNFSKHSRIHEFYFTQKKLVTGYLLFQKLSTVSNFN